MFLDFEISLVKSFDQTALTIEKDIIDPNDLSPEGYSINGTDETLSRDTFAKKGANEYQMDRTYEGSLKLAPKTYDVLSKFGKAHRETDANGVTTDAYKRYRDLKTLTEPLLFSPKAPNLKYRLWLKVIANGGVNDFNASSQDYFKAEVPLKFFSVTYENKDIFWIEADTLEKVLTKWKDVIDKTGEEFFPDPLA